ncbi:HAMP domain-containing sensor histidine kinase [Roseateles asaccharophilus]|uniref:histidine kinase n=1 Tax=Roseateles asaccharophilus TaxID=582607 RepID=A0ABU2AFK0_9BURK|nr:HAMP domain-containing sensor histidine kinase [Roseateles asaccharophilus]MDR7336001.1 signal transduction histidine kinase [Roseateles asaccharophilus]
MSTAPVYRPRLRRRLMLAFTGYALTVSALFGLFAMLFVYAVEDGFFTGVLRQELQRQQAHHATHGDWAQPAQDFIRVYRPADTLPADLAHARIQRPGDRELSGDEGRHYHLQPLGDDGTLLVAEVSRQLVVRPMRQRLLLWLGFWGGSVTLLALALGAWLAWRSSAPLTRLAARVAQSRPEQLPLDLAGPAGPDEDEVGRLARHLAELNQRTRDLIAREQAFTRDASHELRTPLSVLGMACEELQRHAPPGQQSTLATMDAAIWQLQQTVDLLLALAREDGMPGAAPDLPLLPQIEQVVLAHAPLLDRQDIALQVDVPPTLTRAWPPALTRLLLSNLLANALAHRGSPHIRIEADAQRVSLSNASAAPPTALLQAGAAGRDAGVKGEASAGLGLGLSIVRRLAERHGLRLELTHEAGLTRVSLIG